MSRRDSAPQAFYSAPITMTRAMHELRRDAPRRPGPFAVLFGGVGVIGFVLWALSSLSYDIAGGLILAPLMIASGYGLGRRMARRDGDDVLLRILPAALGIKIVGTIARFVIIETVYHGASDSSDYFGNGSRIATGLRHGHLLLDHGRIVGTEAMRITTGVVFAVLGSSRIGGFAFFSALAFLGQIWWCRAHRLASPSGNHRRFCLLMMFMPSLWFWPSSLSKDAWMLGCLGLLAFSIAKLLSGRGGYVGFVLGAAGAMIIRPHVVLAILSGLPVAYLLRRPSNKSALGPVVRIAGALFFVAVGFVAVSRVQAFFGLDSLDTGTVNAVLTTNAERYVPGADSSSFQAAPPKSPLQLPVAAVTVLLRPFPTEAHNSLALATSLEGVALAVIIAASYKSIAAAPRALFSSPWLLVCAAFSLLAIYAFSSFGNFGLLARERVQFLPAIFALLCVAPTASRAARRLPRGDFAATTARPFS